MIVGGGPRHFMMQSEVMKPANPAATLGRLARYFKPYWPILILVAALVIGGAWSQVTTPGLIGQAVDKYLTPTASGQLQILGLSAGASSAGGTAPGTAPAASPADNIRGLGMAILTIAAIYVVGALMSGAQFFFMTWAGQHVLRNLRVQVFAHIHRLSLSYYAENEAGNVMSRLTNDMDTLQQAISFALVSVTSGSLLIAWTAYKMLSRSPVYGLISMAVVPLMAVATLVISSRARKAFRRTRLAIGTVNADLQESISGVREVQAFVREDANIETFRQSNAANRDANIQAVAFTAALSPVLEALGYLAIAIVTITGGIFLLRGQDLAGTAISLGLVVTFLGYVQRFNQPIAQISMLWTNLQSAVAGAERIFGLLDTVPEIQDRVNAQAMPSIVGRVEFDHVYAQYKPGVPVLEDVSFSAEPGQTIAIVGPTGAGKTTMANLIPRFYDVVDGTVCIDGIDVRSVTHDTLRRQIGIVLQDTFLFSDTVLNNIRFGRPDATDEEVVTAARVVHADDFVQRLPDGYNTVLGEHGSGLSQGQRQLVAIARAALADPRILILDEATSSVDTRTERMIQRALEGLLKGRTSFVIAHRLSTVRNADVVLVIQDGKLVERGRHDELLAQRGAFYELYMKQFRQEEEARIPQPGGTAGLTPSPGRDACVG